MEQEKFIGYFYVAECRQNLITNKIYPTIRIIKKEYDNEEALKKNIEECQQEGYTYIPNINDINLFSIKTNNNDLKGYDLKDYDFIIPPVFLYKSDSNVENMDVNEVLNICNKVAPYVKQVVIFSDKEGPYEDYFYDNVTKKLLDNYNRIDYPSKIKCRKESQSGDDNNIADIKTIKETAQIIDVIAQDINQYNFSPLEKVVAISIFSSKLVPPDLNKLDNDEENVGSNIYDSLYTNSIKCAGYVDIFIRIAKKLGIKAKQNHIVVDANKGFYESQRHETAITQIDDEKYNISGDYFFDISCIGSLYEAYLKSTNLPYVSFYENLTYEKKTKARFFGVGKDEFEKYENFVDGVAADYGPNAKIYAFLGGDKLKPYELNFSDESIPLYQIKQAADVVESKYVFNSLNSYEDLEHGKTR